MGFQPLNQETAQTSEVGGFQPLPIDTRGGVGVPLDPETAAALVQARQATREGAGVGVIPQQSQPLSAIIRGILEGSTAGLAPAALEKGIASDQFDPNSPQFTNPLTFGLSEIVGNFAPVGKILQASQKGRQLLTGTVQGGKALVSAAPSLVKTGALTGALYGGAGGEAEALREDQGLKESIQSIAAGAATGGTIGAVTGGLISKAQSLRMTPTENFLAFAKTNPGSKAQNQALEFADSGRLEQAVGSVKSFFKLPKNITTDQANQLVEKTADNLINQVDDLVKQYPTTQLIGSRLKDVLQQEVVDNPILKVLNEKTQKELQDAATEIGTDRTLKEALSLQRKLNKKSRNLIKARNAGGDPKVSDELEFVDVLRRENSKLIDDAITGLTGVEDNPYRRWGSVSQLGDIIEDRFGTLRNLRAQQKTTGLGGKLKNLKEFKISGDEMKTADNTISGLFRQVPEFKAPPLSPTATAERLGRSIRTPTVGPVVPAAPTSLQDVIQKSLAEQDINTFGYF